MSALTLDDVRAAAERMGDAIRRTPCQHALGLSRRTGADVVVKYENMQVTGAFKARGALSRMALLSDAERTRGVVAMSAGNHAQGVAYNAGRLGIPATIVMPEGTPFTKIRRTGEHGATVEIHGETLDEAAAFAAELEERDGLTFIHPYNDPAVIAGQGTVALEMIEDVPDLDVLIVPVGGGGLIAGCAAAAKGLKNDITVIGVEPELYPSLSNAMHGSEAPCEGSTMAEGIAVKKAGSEALATIKTVVDDVLTVSETSLERAVAMFATEDKTVAEGAGAAGLAALLQYPDRFANQKIGLVLSGGNIDARMLSSVLMRDLVRLGRVLTLSIAMPDKPGQLHEVAGICADTGANVLEVAHTRFAMDLSASAARLNITIETRDQAHVDEVIQRLTEAGFGIRIKDPTAP